MLVDTGTADVLWSEWDGNRWILTQQLGEAGFHTPLLDQTSGQPTVSFVMACSAAQSMAVFIGALFAIRTAPWQRRMRALLVTVPTIFVLNTFRNAGIVWLHITYPHWDLLALLGDALLQCALRHTSGISIAKRTLRSRQPQG